MSTKTMTDADMGTWTYEYDLNGNLTGQTDAKGQTLTFGYDALNRLLTKTYPDSRIVSFTYDTGVNGKGRRTGMTDLAGSASYSYDALGRQASVTRVIDGTSYITRTAYTPLGQPASITYPDGEVVSYTYDTGGQLLSVSGAQPYASGLTYDAAGQLTLVQYENGVAAEFVYDANTLRLTRQHAYAATHPTVPLTGWVRSWDGAPQGYATLYRGGICVADGAGSCVGGDLKAEPGVGPAVGYMRTVADVGAVPVYQTHCYSNASGSCIGWGLSLEAQGPLVGYLATTAPDPQSAIAPLTRSGGLLLQNLSGSTPSAYLWTAQTVATNADHVFTTDNNNIAGYTADGTVVHLDQAAEPGTVPLLRFYNAVTGHHYYSTTNDAPVGFVQELTLGYLHIMAGIGLMALHRHYHPTTGDYLLSMSATPPAGYQFQATLGYGHKTIQDLVYAYDPLGNITTITDNLSPVRSQSFTYDSLDRLVGASGPYGTHTYAYNAIGNILSKAGLNYTYGATAQTCNRLMPHAVTATSNGKSYSYDCNGNMLSDGERAFTWDADDRPTVITRAGVGTTTFAYSGDGARVKKVGPTRTIRYVGAFEDSITDNVQVKRIFAGALLVATRVSGGPNAGTYFIHGDHLGSANVITNSSGAEVQRLTYLPFGETSTNVGSVDFHQRRYTGQELDPETGLYFYQARYYDPSLGRFLSADNIVPEPGNPQALNRYSYVNNNPVNFIDPTGHFSLKKVWNRTKRWIKKHQTLATILGVAGQILAPGAGGLLWGTALLTQTDAGRVILTAEIIAATAAASWACGGCAAAPVLYGALAGEVVGAGLGAYSAARAGGNIFEGLLFGAVVGGAAGALGSYAFSGVSGALEGLSGAAWVHATASVLAGAVEGAILGAGSGATIGYGGGTGAFGTILNATGKAALFGAAGGAVLGGVQYVLEILPEATLPDVYAAGGKFLRREIGLGKLVALSASLIPPQAVQYVFFPALQAGAGLELTDPFIEDVFKTLRNKGFLKNLKGKVPF